MNHDDQQRTADASDLDTAYHALARIGRRRGRLDPIAGTLDRALANAFGALHEFRALADAASVAAGFPDVYVRRDLQAGPELQAQARAARLAALEQEETELAERRRRTWRGASKPPCAGPSTTESGTGYGDRSASLLTGAAAGPSAAALLAGVDIGPDPALTQPSPTDAP